VCLLTAPQPMGQKVLNTLDIRDLNHKKNQLLTDMQKIALKGFTAESRAKFDAMQNELDSTEAAITIEQRIQTENSFERSAGRGAIGTSTRPVNYERCYWWRSYPAGI
jgi:hypothetical protein